MKNEFDDFNNDEFFENFPVDEVSAEEIDPKFLKCLKDNFGHSAFRRMQWKVISSVMFDKRDNCVVMATGYGKSLCFQFASVYLDTITVVVSPLISLMEDQVISLTVSNIKACFLGSAQQDKTILNDVFNFKFNIVYVTPEFLTGSFGKTFLNNLSPKLSLIAIDEAHCISKWGHDFRSAFRNLGFIRSCVPNIPILAMTATATKFVQIDICECLNLKNPHIVCTGFDRPNLEFNVSPKSSLGIWKDIGGLIKSVETGSIVVYCLTRKGTEQICEILQSNGVVCKSYHAGLSLKNRKQVHEEFVSDKLQVIVATIAFGMGIDKPDIRMVIHYGASKDIEGYYQEVGRAGRDGSYSKCFMFYSNEDWKIHDILLSKSLGSSQFKENRRNLSLKIREFCTLSTCRREYIIKYFEGSNAVYTSKKSNRCCDNCKFNSRQEKLSEIYEELLDDGSCDFTEDTDNFLRAVNIMGGWKGITTIIYFLRGSKRKALNETLINDCLFGVGKHRSDDYYKMLADLLEINGYIAKKTLDDKNPKKQFAHKSFNYLKFIYVITLTDLAKNWLEVKPRKRILLKPANAMFKHFKLKKKHINFKNETPTQTKNKVLNLYFTQSKEDPVQTLIKNLFQVRSSLASSLDVMPYMILSNKAIHQLAQKCPLNINEFKSAKLDGVSEIKADKFGPVFIKCILQYKNYLLPDKENPNENETNSLSECLKEHPLPNAKPLTSTIIETYNLFKNGKSLREISQIRHLAESTISSYLNESIKYGLLCEKKQLYRLGVSDSSFNLITNTIKNIKNSNNDKNIRLKILKEKCPPTITYDMIKYVLSYHQVREHLNENSIHYDDPDKLTSNEEIGFKSNKEIRLDEKLNESETGHSSNNIDENINWDSDENFDFNEIDDVVTQANTSLVSEISISTELEDMEKLIEYSDDGGDELDWAIEEMQSQNEECLKQPSNDLIVESEKPNFNIINSDEKTKHPVKRKINLKRKNFFYEDSSSSSNE